MLPPGVGHWGHGAGGVGAVLLLLQVLLLLLLQVLLLLVEEEVLGRNNFHNLLTH